MSKSIQIKSAEKADLKAILSLIKNHERYDVEFAKRYYNIYFRGEEITEKDKVYIAKIEENLIGVIGFCRDYFSTDYSYWLGWFVVDEEYRGNKNYKVAKKLLDKINNELRKSNIEKLFVSTEDSNTTAKSFYVKNNFRTEAVLRDYYGENEDQLILSKDFKPLHVSKFIRRKK